MTDQKRIDHLNESLSEEIAARTNLDRQVAQLKLSTLQYETVIDNLAAALFPDPPADSALAEFDLDAMGAVQVIERLRKDLSESQARECALREALSPDDRLGAGRVIYSRFAPKNALETIQLLYCWLDQVRGADLDELKIKREIERLINKAKLALSSPGPCPHQQEAESKGDKTVHCEGP
jgi:hypothetical protein